MENLPRILVLFCILLQGCQTSYLEVPYKKVPTDSKCVEESMGFYLKVRSKSPWARIVIWTWIHSPSKGHAVCVYEHNGELEYYDPFTAQQYPVQTGVRHTPISLAQSISNGQARTAFFLQ